MSKFKLKHSKLFKINKKKFISNIQKRKNDFFLFKKILKISLKLLTYSKLKILLQETLL